MKKGAPLSVKDSGAPFLFLGVGVTDQTRVLPKVKEPISAFTRGVIAFDIVIWSAAAVMLMVWVFLPWLNAHPREEQGNLPSGTAQLSPAPSPYNPPPPPVAPPPSLVYRPPTRQPQRPSQMPSFRPTPSWTPRVTPSTNPRPSTSPTSASPTSKTTQGGTHS